MFLISIKPKVFNLRAFLILSSTFVLALVLFLAIAMGVSASADTIFFDDFTGP